MADDGINGAQVVDQHWPYDGPHSNEATVAAAQAIERLTRYLNNATQGESGAPYAATVGHVVGSLKATAELNRQLLQQLRDTLWRESNDSALYDWVEHGDASQMARDAADHLVAVLDANGRYLLALDEVSQLTSRLSGSSKVE